MGNNYFVNNLMKASVAIYYDSYIYFFSTMYNTLMKLNPNNYEINAVDGMRGYEPDKDNEPFGLIAEGGQLYKLDVTGNRILKYNFETRMCTYYDIGCHYHEWDNFAGLAKYGDEIYVFPSHNKPITKLNILSGNLTKVEHTFFCDMGMENSDKLFFKGICEANIMWLFSDTVAKIVRYDMCNDTFQIYELPSQIHKCIDVVATEQKFYILDNDNSIYKLDIEKECADLQWESIYNSEKEFEFGKLVVTNEKFIILPIQGQDILIIDRNNKFMKIYKEYPMDFKYLSDESWCKYMGNCEDENSIYYPMRSANYILRINKESGNLEWYKPCIVNENEYIKFVINYSRKSVLSESKGALEIFLKGICLRDKS